MNNYATLMEAHKELLDVITGLKETTMSTTTAVSRLEGIASAVFDELSTIYSADPEDVSSPVCHLICSELNKKATEDTFDATDDTTESSSVADETDSTDLEREEFKKAFYERQESVRKRSSGGLHVSKPEIVKKIDYPADLNKNIFCWADVHKTNVLFEPFVLRYWLGLATERVGYTLDMREAVTEDTRKLMESCGGTIGIGDFWKIDYGYDANAKDHFVEIQVLSCGQVSVGIKIYCLRELAFNSRLQDVVDDKGNPSGSTLYDFVKHVNPVYISGASTREISLDESNLRMTAGFVMSTFFDAVASATLIDYNDRADDQ